MAETVIGEWTYKLDHVDAEKSGRLFFRLTQVLGSFIPSIANSLETGEAQADVDQDIMAKALKAINAAKTGETVPPDELKLDAGKAQNLTNATASFADALGKALTQMDPDAGFEVVRDLCELTACLRPSGQYEPVVFAQQFSGNLEDAYDLAFWVANEEYQDLFRKVLARFRGARTKESEVSAPEKSSE